MQALLWMVKHKKIMCNEERKRKGFTTDAKYSFCKEEKEDVDHIFRKCPAGEKIWLHILPPQEGPRQQQMASNEWLEVGCVGKDNQLQLF